MDIEFQNHIAELTRTIGGQYPRPWMTNLTDPVSANVFIVGKNQRNGYETSRISHSRHLDALFNRNGESCRGVYDEITNQRPSPTRNNLDRFHYLLESAGVHQLLETNVICFSTPMSRHLAQAANHEGASNGSEIFGYLLKYIKPRILIAHGEGTCKELSKILNVSFPPLPKAANDVISLTVENMVVYVIPSLAPPKWNSWQRWADEHLGYVSAEVAKILKR